MSNAGSGFATNGAVTVTIGGTAATNVVVVNSTTITATTPAHAPGALPVPVAPEDAVDLGPVLALEGQGFFETLMGAKDVFPKNAALAASCGR